MQYHRSNTQISWEGSSLYNWLNREFKDTAFDAAEQQMIAAPVSILSCSEAAMLPKDYLICMSTSYAFSRSGDTTKCIRWLRDNRDWHYYDDGTKSYAASVVSETGKIAKAGIQVNFNGKFVRPMIVIEF